MPQNDDRHNEEVDGFAAARMKNRAMPHKGDRYIGPHPGLRSALAAELDRSEVYPRFVPSMRIEPDDLDEIKNDLAEIKQLLMGRTAGGLYIARTMQEALRKGNDR